MQNHPLPFTNNLSPFHRKNSDEGGGAAAKKFLFLFFCILN